MNEINRAIAQLSAFEPAPTPLPQPPSWRVLHGAARFSWLLLAGLLAVAGWRGVAHPPAWLKPAPATPEATQPVQISWPHRPTDSPLVPQVKATLEATAAQLKQAQERGRALAAPYKPESFSTLLIFAVPAEGGNLAVMLYDGRRGQLAGKRVYVLDFRPAHWSQLLLENNQGVFLEDR